MLSGHSVNDDGEGGDDGQDSEEEKREFRPVLSDCSLAKTSWFIPLMRRLKTGDRRGTTSSCNRSKKIGKSFAKGDSLKNARLLKVGIKNGTVDVTDMDRSESKTADRLFLLISRDDLNAVFKK